jgi:ferredoxin
MTARWLLALWLYAVPAIAAAHGESHGEAAPVGTAGAVGVQGYQVELATHPGPLALGRETHLIAKVSTGSPPEAASAGRVRIAFGPAGAAGDPRPAPETTWAGSYGIAVTPEHEGPHAVRVLIDELAERHFHPPLVVELAVAVGPPPGLGTGAWVLLAVVAGLAGVTLWGFALRARFIRPGEARLNLLDVPWLRRLLASRALQPALQVPLLALMAVVVVVGFADVQDGGKNLATKLTWTIWWAGIIFTFFLAGRAWCLACPFGALNEWASRLAAPARRLPAPFRNIWWATGLFVLLTWADEQLGVVRSPRVTAVIVLIVAGLAVGIGLFFERRSFCRHLCPIGGLIGIYAMTAPVELRAKQTSVCAADREKACFRGTDSVAGCPMFEFPGSLERNNYCNLCGQCVTACTHGNLALRVRAFGQDLWAAKRRVLDESYLAIALVGLTYLVTAQMLAAWPGWISALARWLPDGVRASVRPVTYLGAVESAVLLGGSLVAVPLLVLGAAALADRLAGHALGVRRTFVVFGYMFVPVGLAMHLAHNLAHLLLEGGGIVPVVQRAVALYTPISLGSPDWRAAPLAPEPVVGLLQLAVLVGFFLLSLRVGSRLSLRVYGDARAAGRALIPLVALATIFTLVGVVLLSLPMGMRHG